MSTLRYCSIIHKPTYQLNLLNVHLIHSTYANVHLVNSTLPKNRSRPVLSDTKKRAWSKPIIFTPNSRNPFISSPFAVLTSVLLTSIQPSQRAPSVETGQLRKLFSVHIHYRIKISNLLQVSRCRSSHKPLFLAAS